MKKLFFFILLTVSTLLYANHNWVALKLGYGNETVGIGIAVEGRLNDFGLVLGASVPNERIGTSITTKYYFYTTEEQSFFLSLGYGMLGFLIIDVEIDVIETSYVYGPYVMIGSSNMWGNVLGDYSLGFGYSYPNSNLVLTAQASIGFVISSF